MSSPKFSPKEKVWIPGDNTSGIIHRRDKNKIGNWNYVIYFKRNEYLQKVYSENEIEKYKEIVD